MKTHSQLILLFYRCCLLGLISLGFFVQFTHAENQAILAQTETALSCGWYSLYPYQYSVENESSTITTGLDIELAHKLAKKAGFRIMLTHKLWSKQLKDVENGSQDMALGALKTAAREKKFYFSDPIRHENTVLYSLAGSADNFDLPSVKVLIEYIKSHNLKIGIMGDYAYSDPEVNEFIKNPANSRYFLKVNSDAENFNNLKFQKVKAILVDRIVGASIVQTNNWGHEMAEAGINFGRRPLHFVFSRKTVSAQTVQRFNAALKEFREAGEYSKLIRHYLFPVMLNVTVNQRWYFIMVIIGTLAYSIAALRIAYNGHYSLVGALIIAATLSLGGGSLRDIIVSRSPIFVLRDPMYLYLVIATTVIGVMLIRVHHYFHPFQHKKGIRKISEVGTLATNIFFKHLFDMFDAMGLAAFTVIGVVVAMETQCSPLLIWGPLLAICSTAGGGILCDILCWKEKNATMRGSFYAEVAAIWGFFLTAFFQWQSDKAITSYIIPAVAITSVGVFVTRMLAIKLKWQGLMLIPHKEISL